MDRRKTLATVGAISLTASAAVVALGSSMGLFGLTNDSPRVGRLSPIDATRAQRTVTTTVYVDDPVPVPSPSSTGPVAGSAPGHSESGPGATNERQPGPSRSSSSATNAVTPPAPPTAQVHDHEADASSSVPGGAPAAGHPGQHDDD